MQGVYEFADFAESRVVDQQQNQISCFGYHIKQVAMSCVPQSVGRLSQIGTPGMLKMLICPSSHKKVGPFKSSEYSSYSIIRKMLEVACKLWLHLQVPEIAINECHVFLARLHFISKVNQVNGRLPGIKVHPATLESLNSCQSRNSGIVSCCEALGNNVHKELNAGLELTRI
jgi:hypothetical protein